MVKRRKFLIGAGALAAGSAAAVGTGAFNTSYRVDRTMSVDVAGDSTNSGAYLGIEPNEASDFVSTDGADTLDIDLSSNSPSGGNGVPNNGSTEVRPAFTIKNQHTSTLYIEIDNPASNSDITGGGVDVQFLAAETSNGNLFYDFGADTYTDLSSKGGSSGGAILCDRTNKVIQGSLSGNVDPATIPNTPGSSSRVTFEGSKAHPFGGTRSLEMSPGGSTQVMFRVVANNASNGEVTDGPAAIEAYTDESETTISGSFKIA